jgi:hypothetical protein
VAVGRLSVGHLDLGADRHQPANRSRRIPVALLLSVQTFETSLRSSQQMAACLKFDSSFFKRLRT